MTKLQLRRAWFQLHKWIGLGLAILIIPLSLSGALLVWDQPLDRLLNPARYATTGTTQLPLDRYLTAARAALPLGTPIASVAFPDGAGPVIVQASTPGAAHRAGPPARTSVWLDPPTARLLAVADSRAGALRFIHMLHGNLLVPGVGRTIVGWIGVAMALSCLTGLWLWWPLIGKWSRGLRWRRHRNFDTNLHHLFGFWIALPLFVLSVTGAWIAFPMVFLPSRGEHGPPRERLRGDPVAAPDTLPHAVIDAAQKATHVPIRSLVWPVAGRDPAWVIVTSGATLTLDDRSGAITTAPSGPRGGATSLSGIMRRLHDGEGMGAVWQTIIFIGGILPSGLAVTGIVMWWRARSWRHKPQGAALTARLSIDGLYPLYPAQSRLCKRRRLGRSVRFVALLPVLELVPERDDDMSGRAHAGSAEIGYARSAALSTPAAAGVVAECTEAQYRQY